MNGLQLRSFLTGQFATWFASKRGHSTPTAQDKQDAEAIANSAVDLFQYRLKFGS
jgi:hypothetical protein